jgi:RNA polymerase sigma-70 factor (ECF subfamily)
VEGEDVVQEAMIAALTTNALPNGDVGAWLRAIVVRKALDQLRRRRRRAERPLAGEREPDRDDARAEPSGHPTVDEAIEARELLARLSAEDRAVLWLADVEGRTMGEIAQAIGSTRVAVKLRASRARRRLARWSREGSTRVEGERRRS